MLQFSINIYSNDLDSSLKIKKFNFSTGPIVKMKWQTV